MRPLGKLGRSGGASTRIHSAGWAVCLYADAKTDGRLTDQPVLGGTVFIDLFGPGGIGHGQVTHVGIVESVTGDELVIIQGNGKPDPTVVTRTTHTLGDGYIVGFAPFSKEVE